jgi:glycosyltransferase involved in cell wall biosynthesis
MSHQNEVGDLVLQTIALLREFKESRPLRRIVQAMITLSDKTGDEPIRILAFLDDTVVSGNVKPVLGFARSALHDDAARRSLEVSMASFARSERDLEFVEMLRAQGFAVDVVRERGRFDFGIFPQLREIVASRRPHVLWTHGAKTHFLVRAARLHAGRAWVASHHGYTATSLTWTLYDQLDRWSLHGADRVVTVCDAFAADLKARLHIPPERLSVHRSPIVPRAVPRAAGDSALREELGLAPNAEIVLSVGRLSKEKGHADLVRAIAVVRRTYDSEVVLVIVGEGPERASLERLCARLNLTDVVKLVGYKDNVSPYYAAANVFVLPSYSEGSPNVLLEAMDAGVPIVATSVGGVGEMIHHGEQGWLVPSGDSERLAGGIVHVLSTPDLREAFIREGRRTLAAYHPALYYAGVRSLFERVADDAKNGVR